MRLAINEIGEQKTRELVLSYASETGLTDIENLQVVLSVCFQHSELCPLYQLKKGTLPAEKRVAKWVECFAKGYANRISQHISNMPGTLPDKILNAILKARLPHLSDLDCDKIIYAHRLSMSIENIQGLLLEEYLSRKMRSLSWYMAWGATITAVDMCSASGDLLQIKNQSNTENSSSNKVRVGMPIHKWYRRNASTGETMWPDLCALVG